MNPRLLLIEDDAQIYRFLAPVLAGQGFQVVHAASLAQAASVQEYALVLLDLGLPDGDGVDWIRQMRAHSDLPIVVLSARQSEADKVESLNAGADDYLAKPFGIQELLARIRAALRRSALMQMRDHDYQCADVVIQRSRGQVQKNGQAVHLTPIEHALLMQLASKPGTLFTHAQLLQAVWGPEYINDTQYLRIHIGRLRAKLEDQPAVPKVVLTELGIGYRLATSI